MVGVRDWSSNCLGFGVSDSLPQLDHVAFDGLGLRWSVCRGIIQGETGPSALVAPLNGVEPGGSDRKYHSRMKITDKGFHAGKIVCAVFLQGCLVRMFGHDGELYRCGGKSNAPEAHILRLLPPREDMQICWVVYNDLDFDKYNFAVSVAHGPKTDQGMLEQRHDFA